MDYKSLMGYGDKKKESKPKVNKVLNSIKEEFGYKDTLKEVGAAPQYKKFVKSIDKERDKVGRETLKFVDLLRNTNATNIIRITGDCPLIDPLLVDKIIKAFLERNVDYGSNVNPPTFPDGMDVEIFSRHCIEKINNFNLNKYHLEHVTSYMREDENILKYNYKNDKDFSNIRITLDEEIDLGVLNSIVNYFAPNIYFTLEDIINLYKENKSLFKNVDLNRNEGAEMSSGQKMWKKAKKIIPGGNMLLSKRTEMFRPLSWPAYFDKAKGCNIWDLDGNKYLDMVSAYSAVSHGNSHPELVKTIKKQSEKCDLYPLEVNYCEKCHNCQLSVAVDPKKMFSNYLYTSSTSKIFRDHFVEAAKKYSKELNNKVNLTRLIDGEDYNRLVPLSSVDSIPAASYIMTVTDGPESDMSTELNLYVIEFQSVSIVVGFTLPESVKIEKEIEFLFTR